MGIIFAVFLLILLVSAFGIGRENKDFLSREMTTTINGYFLTTVFMTHIIQYLSSSKYNAIDWFYIDINRALGQLIVAMFLFYSGYGIMESIKHKDNYIHTFPRKRLIPFVIDFEIAVLIYTGVSCITGDAPTFHYFLKAIFAWESVGNSNWYIFAIMYLYVTTYVVFRIFPKKSPLPSIFLIFVFTVYYIYVMPFHKGGWWYDTALCYPVGMLFSYKVDTFRQYFCAPSRKKYYAAALTALIVCFAFVYNFRKGPVWNFELLAVLFALSIVMITVRFKATNRIYSYIGKNLFFFYIYQRVFMILLKDSLARYNIYLYFAACMAGTAAISFLMIGIKSKIKQRINS